MAIEDGETGSSSTNGESSGHEDEFRVDGVEEVSEASERRCGTEIRQAPAECVSHEGSGSPVSSLEGLILKITSSEVKIGKKIGEGAQAKLYAGRYVSGGDVVVKKFKHSFSALDCAKQGQWPTELFRRIQWHVCQLIGYIEEGESISLVMCKYDGDLRRVINKEWPFKPQVALDIVTQIAMGMKLLHDQGVTHNDLKAENILVQTSEDNIPFSLHIGDFENSVRNEGTAFWRPPEVFSGLKEREDSGCLIHLPFSKPGDVYSFGMVCYEVLTGKVPFEGHPKSDYDLILEGNRPELPMDLDMREMIPRCWHGDPNARPSFADICLELRQRAEAVDDAASRDVVMAKFRLFDEFCGARTGREVCELKQMVQSLAQEYGSETKFVRLGFELVMCIEQFMFQCGSLGSSFIDAPVLPFSKWLDRMWLCNAIQFKRHLFVDALPCIRPAHMIVKLVWDLTANITDGCERTTWGDDDSMTQEEKMAALEAFKEEQARQIRIQKQQLGSNFQQVCVRPFSKLKCLAQRAMSISCRILGMPCLAHRCEFVVAETCAESIFGPQCKHVQLSS